MTQLPLQLAVTFYLLAPLVKNHSATGSTITTDVDASGAGSAYTFAYSGTQALVQRAVKIAVTGQAVIVEEIHVVGG